MPKVAFLLQNLLRRGTQRVAHTLYQYLKNFYDIDVFAGPHILNADFMPATVVNSPPSNLDEYDIVHLHLSNYDWDIPRQEGLRCKLIVTNHQVSPTYTNCRFPVSVYPRSGFIHIDNPFYLEDVECDSFEINNIISGRPYSLTVGNYSMEKGADIFLSAVENLNTSSINMVFVGGTDGEYYSEIFNHKFDILKQRNCTVTKLPSVSSSELSALIQNAKAIVHTSRSEAASLTLIEAQMRCIPIVCLDVGGNKYTAPCASFLTQTQMHRFPSIFFDRALLAANANRITERHNPVKIASKYKELYDAIAYPNR